MAKIVKFLANKANSKQKEMYTEWMSTDYKIILSCRRFQGLNVLEKTFF